MDIEIVKSLLIQASLPTDDIQIEYFTAGGNNSIYKLSAGGKLYALKKYKRDANDTRDRLGAEWAFLSAVQNTLDHPLTPKAYAVDREHGLALYDFIDGQKISKDAISDSHIDQACAFIKDINAPHLSTQISSDASESRFSTDGHLEILRHRIDRISDFKTIAPDFIEKIKFVTSDIEIKIKDSLSALDFKHGAEIPPEIRCISPSDFGFHNALEHNGRLSFIDFEYAGWDDPAKLTADFFFQPEITVPEKYLEKFILAAHAHISMPEQERYILRSRILRPLFGLRWCCIILNPFNPDWENSKNDNNTSETLAKLRVNRLNSAELLLEKTQEIISKTFK